jgi:membrane dipeptidase
MTLTPRSIIALAVLVSAFAAVRSENGIAAPNDRALAARVDRVLRQVPLIDGHNDLAWEIRERFGSVAALDLGADTAHLAAPANAVEPTTPLMTDIPRLRSGHVGGQFWSVWIPPTITGAAAVKMTIEQIDIVHGLIARYPQDLSMAYSAQDIMRAATRSTTRCPRCAKCSASARAT